MRIGIDFDNTIACYDQLFCDVALKLGMLDAPIKESKVDLKQKILKQPSGDLAWQRLQGQVYGKYMHQAKVFFGFFEFLYLSKLRGYEVYIVSHKTQYGHFDEEKISLWDEALAWLKLNGCIEQAGFVFSQANIFFEITRESKIERITSLGCTHFIDDLLEVLQAQNFPSRVQKILFSPSDKISKDLDSTPLMTAASWREITSRIHGDWTETDVCRVAQAKFPALGISRAELRKGRGNSRIYKLTGTTSNYALKIYPDRQRDPRPRLETEFSACRALYSDGYPVPKAVSKDERLGWAVYSWIDGQQVNIPTESFFTDATQFIKRLYKDRARLGAEFEFGSAAESCLTGKELVEQIDRRLNALRALQSDELFDFLQTHLLPYYATCATRAKQLCGDSFYTELDPALQILSPSDFGSHNALLTADQQTFFVDFEYFGWDDPAKLVCDVYWHPGMKLSEDQQAQWISFALGQFKNDPTFERRFNAYLPLYGIRWCLILLKEFHHDGAAARLHTGSYQPKDLMRIRDEQLNKAKLLLEQIKVVNCEHG